MNRSKELAIPVGVLFTGLGILVAAVTFFVSNVLATKHELGQETTARVQSVGAVETKVKGIEVKLDGVAEDLAEQKTETRGRLMVIDENIRALTRRSGVRAKRYEEQPK